MVKRRKNRDLKSLREKVNQAIKEFNKYRSPEATAKLIKINRNEIKIKFFGTFCKTCGFYDYFEDFIIFLEERKIKCSIKEIKEIQNGAIVKFSFNDYQK